MIWARLTLAVFVAACASHSQGSLSSKNSAGPTICQYQVFDHGTVSLRFVGNEALSHSGLCAAARQATTRTYPSGDDIRASSPDEALDYAVLAIRDRYYDAGYVDVRHELARDHDGTRLSTTLHITEGSRFRIGTIRVELPVEGARTLALLERDPPEAQFARLEGQWFSLAVKDAKKALSARLDRIGHGDANIQVDQQLSFEPPRIDFVVRVTFPKQ